MLTEAQIWYRTAFLKSEEWDNIRISILVKFHCVCQLCGVKDQSNDVHHIWYDCLFKPEEDQFSVLCRKCHELVHEYIKPCTAHSEREKRLAKGKFLRLRKALEMQEFGDFCITCGCKNKEWWNPVRGVVEVGSGSIFICPACQTDLRSMVRVELFQKPAAAWEKIHTALGQMRLKNNYRYRRNATLKPAEMSVIHPQFTILTSLPLREASLSSIPYWQRVI